MVGMITAWRLARALASIEPYGTSTLRAATVNTLILREAKNLALSIPGSALRVDKTVVLILSGLGEPPAFKRHVLEVMQQPLGTGTTGT
jgi:hypothetical protein